MAEEKKRSYPGRICLLDFIRGFTLINMIIYHTLWDMVYIFKVDIPWFYDRSAYIYQQAICWTFIFLSGFCFNLGRNHIRRGLTVLAGGIIVSLVTIIFMPDDKILFSVLTFMGLAMLICTPLEKYLKKINVLLGFVASALLFFTVRNVTRGSLGFEGLVLADLPDSLYHGGFFGSLIGFHDQRISSADYFPLFPWLFLFLSGYFLGGMLIEKMRKSSCVMNFNFMPINFLGRHSLIIYMIHQPVVYGILLLIFN